jgi:hypothetical protein
MPMITRYTFEAVKYKANVSFVLNGKKVTRHKTFEQTLNPFNTNDDGTVKTYAQIMDELRLKAAAWRIAMKAGGDD